MVIRLAAPTSIGRFATPGNASPRSSVGRFPGGAVLAVLLVIGAVSAAGCAPSLLKLPQGAGIPAADAADALADATAACTAVSTLTAEIAVGGSIAGHRVRGRMLAGLAPASARLEAVAPAGQPIFIFVADGGDATLLLPRDGRILQHGQPAAVLEAVAGVPLDAIELKTTLTGCSLQATGEGRQFGSDWRVIPAGTVDVYLRRGSNGARWQLVAAVHQAAASGSGWRAEYTQFENGLPRSVRLTSAPAKRFDLVLTLSQIELNTRLGPDVFRVQIPPGVEPMTLEELRQSGPLAAPDARQR
jgi:hypothetical protein